MSFKTENFDFFLFFLLGKGKANYLSRKVILEKIFMVFQSRDFGHYIFPDKAENFHFVPANFYLLLENLYSKVLNIYSKLLNMYSKLLNTCSKLWNKHYLR